MRRKTTLLLFFVVFAIATAPNCPDKKRIWYETLKADQFAYEAITDEIGARYLAGGISEEDYEKLIEFSERWAAAHIAASQALLVYHHIETQSSEATVLEALLELSSIVADLKRAWAQQ